EAGVLECDGGLGHDRRDDHLLGFAERPGPSGRERDRPDRAPAGDEGRAAPGGRRRVAQFDAGAGGFRGHVPRGRPRPAPLGRPWGPAFRLVILALSRGDARRRARYERFLVEQGPDRLLDEPGLLEGLLAVRSLAAPSPPLFTYVAVRHVLLAAGIDDPELADYLAALLLEFGD